MLPNNSNINKSNKTIYINPNFRGQLPTAETSVSLQSSSVIPKNAHINPLFLETHKPRHTIHMNPAFLQKFQEHQESQQQQQNKAVGINNLLENQANSLMTFAESNEMATNSIRVAGVTADSRKIICKSKNRLIREPLINKDCSNLKLSKPSIPQSPLLVLNKRKLIRKISTLPAVNIDKTEAKSNNEPKAIITKYKLDNRAIRKRSLLPPTPKIKRTAYVGRYALRRTSMGQSSNILSIKKTLTMNKNLNKKLQVLNINGLLYKSTKNSLQLKGIGRVQSSNEAIMKSTKTQLPGQKPTTNLNPKSNQGLSIFVRGTKYVMDVNKFKLTRVTNADQTTNNPKAPSNNSSKIPTCQRIDIGGYTYISVNSAKNVLIRTTNHLSRAYVHNAKQKSLQMLTKRLVKTNIPCPIFQRIGKCAAFERGKCSKVHNKLQVAICSKFLRGECVKTNCLLSHNVSLSKMPVCKFFLQGVCVRNDCPYLHKKLSNKAELCTDFLRGFCQLAEKCNKRHEFICPEIERNNACNTKNCIYCNAKRRKELQIEKNSGKLQNINATHLHSTPSKDNSCTVVIEETPSSKRYFIESYNNIIEQTDEVSNVETVNENTDKNMKNTECIEGNTEVNRKTRPKLGILPAYIPL